MNQIVGKALFGTLTFLVLAGILIFVISHESKDRYNDQIAASGQRATTFPINVTGLATPTSTNYVYRVVAPAGTTATITYVNQNGTRETVKDADLPWSITTTTNDGQGVPKGAGQPPYVTVKTNSHGHSVQATCQAFGDGKRSDQETANGVDATVHCGSPY